MCKRQVHEFRLMRMHIPCNEDAHTITSITLTLLHPPPCELVGAADASKASGSRRTWLAPLRCHRRLKHATVRAAAADADEASSMLPHLSLRPLCGCLRMRNPASNVQHGWKQDQGTQVRTYVLGGPTYTTEPALPHPRPLSD